MLFITNRVPEQSLRSKQGRKWTFDMSVNVPSPAVFFCRRGLDDAHEELTSTPFMQQIKDDPAKHVMFHLHGFSTSPNDVFSAVEEMQDIADRHMGADFVRIVPIIWPADADRPIVGRYYSDRDAAMDSRAAFARALNFFLDWQRSQHGTENRCSKPISVFAHSMGNRVLRETLFYLQDEFLRRGMPRIFRCVFLSAADIINETLEKGETGQYIADSAARVISYYAYDDLALRGSKFVNLDQTVSRRLGHTGPEDMSKVARNVFALDCGSFNTNWDPPSGHSYYRKERDGARRDSPLLHHALDVMKTLDVNFADVSTRDGAIPNPGG
jgi:esterase/lipase superfamily enzyme